MGSSGSSNRKNGKMNIQEVSGLQSNRSRFEDLIYEKEYMHESSGSSRQQSTFSKQSSSPSSVSYQQALLKQQSTKKPNQINENNQQNQQRRQSCLSNFDKLTLKSQRIEELNDMLDDEIYTFHKEKKKQLLLNKRDTQKINVDGKNIIHLGNHNHINNNNNSNKDNNASNIHTKRPRRKRTQTQSLVLGIWLGITISIFIVLVVIVQINKLSIANQSSFSRDFPTWRGIAIWIFYVWMLGFDISMYNKFRIRYREIFKIKPDHYPQAVNICRIAGFHSSVFVILFLLYVLDVAGIYQIRGFGQQYFALISWGLFALFLFMPLPIFSNKGRYFVFGLVIDSILSPFKGVTFPVTWLTDQAVSMAVPLKDLQYTICYYTEMDYMSQQNVCQDSNRISTVMIVAVSVCSIRMIQCMRQGYDKGEYFMTPFFFNTLKYLATLLTAIFAFYYKLGADQIQAAWLLFAIISSVYSFTWDLRMDWDLLQTNKLHPLLRQKLIFGSPRVYYLIIVGNFLMRLAWIITISPKLAAFLGNNNLVFLVTGMIEIFRRGIWNLLRVQKQHIALITKPIKNETLNEKALQLQKKLATVEHSLNLQIKMLKFFKKFESNRQNLLLSKQMNQLDEQNLVRHEGVIEDYNRRFQTEELREISQLMGEMLKKDSFLKRKLEEQCEKQGQREMKQQSAQQNDNREGQQLLQRKIKQQQLQQREQLRQITNQNKLFSNNNNENQEQQQQSSAGQYKQQQQGDNIMQQKLIQVKDIHMNRGK